MQPILAALSRADYLPPGKNLVQQRFYANQIRLTGEIAADPLIKIAPSPHNRQPTTHPYF
jgi:hypothetical protein